MTKEDKTNNNKISKTSENVYGGKKINNGMIEKGKTNKRTKEHMKEKRKKWGKKARKMKLAKNELKIK